MARASMFSNIKDYLLTADEEICILLQIENLAGIDALDEILKIDAVDGLFIGRSDLAADLIWLADMGYRGQVARPEVRGKVIETLKRIKKAVRQRVSFHSMTLFQNNASKCPSTLSLSV